MPGGAGNITGGVREFIPHMTRAAISVGVEGLFMEVHPDPEKALSDATTQFPLAKVAKLLKNLLEIDTFVKNKVLGFD